MKMEDERRKDLEKYYNHIYLCKFCNKKYGSNLIDNTETCPECIPLKKRKNN